ncbi:hypothetical protein CK203_026902 [Vitis vinifera]|uniref:Uncharacterized protein n=1 Tax=Vitis vinifera TaxID=29760 RepID=A0A438IP91_VITVI|nr:hypothetical protein CK203_026902 [Vitis vinifera]
MSERESFWKQVIIGKFGEDERGWCALEARKRYGVGLWKAIRKGWGAFKKEESSAHPPSLFLGKNVMSAEWVKGSLEDGFVSIVDFVY